MFHSYFCIFFSFINQILKLNQANKQIIYLKGFHLQSEVVIYLTGIVTVPDVDQFSFYDNAHKHTIYNIGRRGIYIYI